MRLLSGESIFTYPLTRHYPFAWFTWLVVVTLLICAVLFTFIALAADGYNSSLIYTTDLNGTMTQNYWFRKAPFSWISQVEVACQPALLTPGYSFYTSNQALLYSIISISKQENGFSENVPAAAYSNASLLGCQVTEILTDFQRATTAILPKDWWAWSRTTAPATAQCTISSGAGSMQLKLQTQLPPVAHPSVLEILPSLNISQRANIWFGAQFLDSNYQLLSKALGYQSPYQKAGRDSGYATLFPNPNVTDYTSQEFFLCRASFSTSDGGLSHFLTPYTLAHWVNQWTDGSSPPMNLPNISLSVDLFGKNFNSLILSDLGVSNGSNALVSPEGLIYLQTRNDTDLVAASRNQSFGQGQPIQNVHNGWQGAYAISSAYQDAKRDLGHDPNLNSTPSSTIFTQYLCSVLKIKAGGSLFISVLIADIVFLRIVWSLLNIGATLRLGKREPQANYCAACVASGAKEEPDNYVLLPVSKSSPDAAAFEDGTSSVGEGHIGGRPSVDVREADMGASFAYRDIVPSVTDESNFGGGGF